MKTPGWIVCVTAVVLSTWAFSLKAVGESVVHDTSAEFAAGTFTDSEDAGSGATPLIKIVSNLPYNGGDGRNGSPSIGGDPNSRASCSGSSGGTSLSTSLTASAGDVVLIHQSRGAGAGNWEFNKVVTANGSTMTVLTPLAFSYIEDGGNSQAQVVLVPQYSDLTITGGGPAGWNGDTGGIYAVMCSGTVTITGALNAQGLGFRGGASAGDDNAWTGEGSGSVTLRNTPDPPGSGGGTQHVSNAGGGNGTAGTSGGEGAVGDAAGTADLTTAVFGGGGGGGASGGSNGNGSPGGGFIVIVAKSITGSGNINSAGVAGGNAAGGRPGGGGAGGSVLLKTSGVTVSSLSAPGGPKGTGGGDPHSGDGGTGRIRVEYAHRGFTSSTNPTASTVLNYKIAGTYISPGIDAGMTAIWGTLEWTAAGGTSVQFRTRSATTLAGLSGAAWSSPLTVSGSQIASGNNRYIQYEAALSGTSSNSPSVSSVTINYITVIPPSITLHPTSTSVCAGEQAMFTVAASGDPVLLYQWQKDMSNLSEGGHYSGVNSATLMVSNTDGGDVGAYRCVVSNNGGSATSTSATLAVDTTDTDSDGTADCGDGCPNDPAKTAAGVCGCGTPDADTDSDGAEDCIDACPTDPAKTTFGECGCFVAEADTDGDGTPDCNDVDRLLHFQGKLKDAGGATVNGTADLTFRFYDAPDGGNLFFTETHTSVNMTRGLFSVILGSQTTGGVPDTAVDRQDAFVSVAVNGGGELSPRSRVPAEPFVTKAKAAEGLVKPGTLNPAVAVDAAGNVGIGTTAPGEKLHVIGDILATGSITPGSSITLKKNVAEVSLPEADSALDALRPVKFEYKADAHAEQHLGFIAEEVPDLVSTGGRMGVDPMDIVAVLTKVVQRQQETIRRLEEANARQEARLTELECQLGR